MARYPQRAQRSMPAQSGGAATLDGSQHLEMSAGDPVTTRFQKGLPRHPDEVGHLQRRPMHLGLSRRFAFLHPGSERQRVQGTRRGTQMAAGKVEVNRRLFQIAVTEQQLDSAQVRSRFQ